MDRKNITFSDLIEPAIILEVQKNFSTKHNVGLCMYDLKANPITTISIDFPATANLSPNQKSSFGIFFNLDKVDTRMTFADGQALHRSFLDNLVSRVIFPIISHDKLLGVVCLVKIAKTLQPDIDKVTLNSIKDAAEDENLLHSMMDAKTVMPPPDIKVLMQQFQSTLSLFLEAGWARTKLIDQVTSAKDFPQMPMDDSTTVKVERTRDCIIFCTADGTIIDSTEPIIDILAYERPEDLIGQNVIHELVLEPQARSKIKNIIDTRENLDWYPVVLLRNDGVTFPSKLKFMSQKEGRDVIGYEIHIKSDDATRNQAADASYDKPGIMSKSLDDDFANAHMDELLLELKDQQDQAESDKAKKTKKKNPKLYDEHSKPRGPLAFSFKGVSQLLDAVPNPLIVLDENQRINVWNQSVEKLLGIKAVSVLETDFRDLIPAEQRTDWNRWMKDTLRTEHLEPIDTTKRISLVKKDSNIANLDIKLARSKIHGKHYISLLIDTGTTDKSKAQQTFDESPVIQALFRSSKCRFISNKKGQIQHVSESAVEYMQKTRDEISHTLAFDLFKMEIDDQVAVSSLSKNESKLFDTQIVSGTHPNDHVQVTVEAIQIGKNTRLLWTLEPLPSSQKSAMVRLFDIQSSYKRITDHYEVLANTLQGKIYPSGSRAAGPELKVTANRMALVARHLKFFSGKIKPSCASLDVTAFLGQFSRKLERALPNRLSLELDFNDNAGYISADKNQILFVLGILCKNAIEAIHHSGKLRLQTALLRTDHPLDGQIRTFSVIRVSDNGMGMNERILPHLFEPFNTTKENGLGLGLAAIYGIVMQHQGFVDVQSDAVSGTTVSLFFPKIDVQRTTPKQADTSRGSILIIDDEIGVAEVSSTALHYANYHAIAVHSGQDGLATLKAKRSEIDLIILDVLMLDMTGQECAEQIQKIEPTIPIIFTSGASPDQKLALYIKDINAGWLAKPYTSQKLVDAVSKKLGQSSKR